MAAFRLRILGSGEAFDTGLGNNSGLVEPAERAATGSARGPRLLIDCGYQIPERLWALPARQQTVDAVYFTHLHADHCFGFVPLAVRWFEERREKPLQVFGPRGTKKHLSRLLELGYPGALGRLSYPIRFTELKDGSRARWRGFTLECARTDHPAENLALRLTAPGGFRLGWSGDGRDTPASRRLLNATDLLVHECFSDRPVNPVHADLRSLTAWVRGPRRVVVTHISRNERPLRLPAGWKASAEGQCYRLSR